MRGRCPAHLPRTFPQCLGPVACGEGSEKAGRRPSRPQRTATEVIVHEHQEIPARLTGGGTAMLRPLEPGEDAALLAVFEGLSARSRELRFLTAMNTLRPSVVRALTDVDGCRHVAWLATVDGLPAGIARYARVPDGPADLAFDVVDAQQGRGLGSLLLDAVATLARANAVNRVSATVHPGNRVSVHLL